MNRLSIWTLLITAGVAYAEPPAKSPATFENDVRPILRKHCVACHNEERPRGDLDLTSFQGVMNGGVSGKAVVSGKPEASLLYALVAHLDDPKMPPNKPKIPQREIDTLARWIEGGLMEKPNIGPMKAVAQALPSSEAGVGEPGGLTRPIPLPKPTPITALATSPTAPLAAVPGLKQALLLNLTELKPEGALPFPEGEIHTLSFSPDGRWLFVAGGVGGQSGAVAGFEVGSWNRRFTWDGETDTILTLDIAPDQSAVAVGGPSRVVRVIALPDGKVLHTHRKNTDWVTAVAFSPDGLLLAAGDRFGGLYVWEAKSGKEFWNLRGHTRAITSLAWQGSSDRLISSSEDGTIRIWDMHTGHETEHWTAHESGVTSLARINSNDIVTAGRDHRLRLWSAKGELRTEIGQTADVITRLARTHDGNKVISGDWTGRLFVWPLAGGPSSEIPLPIAESNNTTAVIPVPVPRYPSATMASIAEPKPGNVTSVPAGASGAKSPSIVTQADLDRKRATLKAVEEAIERVKEEAARNPGNPALAEAYLKLCEVALVLKTDLLSSEGGKAP